MSDEKRNTKRGEREKAIRAVYARMQRDIDSARHQLWKQYFAEFAAVNPRSTTGYYIAKFDEAWRHSLLPNTERDDMDADGNYRTAA